MAVNETLSDYVAGEIRASLARQRTSGRELADKLGVSRSWVSYRLTGTTEISINDLQRIAAALDVDVTDLLPAPARRGEGGEPRSNPDLLQLAVRPRLTTTGTLCPPPSVPPAPEMPVPAERPASRRLRRPVASYTHVTDGAM